MEPECSERVRASEGDEETTPPMDEEEKPPPEAKDKTLVVPTPVEKPPAAPARTRTSERRLSTANAKPARTRTVDRRLSTAEPPVQAEGEEAEGEVSHTTLPGAPSRSEAQVATDTFKALPQTTLPGAPHEKDEQEEAPPAPVERTVMVPFPEPTPTPAPTSAPAAPRRTVSTVGQAKVVVPAPSAEPAATGPRRTLSSVAQAKVVAPAAAAEPAATGPRRTLSSVAQAKVAVPATPVERTVIGPAPEAPSQSEPHDEAALAATYVKRGPPARSKSEPELKTQSEPQSQTQPESEPQANTEPPADPAAETGKGPFTQPTSRKTKQEAEPEVNTQPQQAAEEELTEGMKLGGYQLIRKIGIGGMGTVWLASQLSLDREVAVKILRPSFAGDPQFVYRFTQEAFAAAQLIHHNIVQIYDCGSEKQIHFFSMEFVDAQSLLTLVKRTGTLEPEEAAGYILQAARGLKFAHDRGMVHRDIKPDNLLLNNNGIVKVADMGLVKLAKRARRAQTLKEYPLTYIGKNPQEYAMGTPAYIAPEQVENSSKVDARADIYSLGCTFYHLLTGRAPFTADTVNAVMDMHVKEPPVPPNKRNSQVPEVLSAIVMKMMVKRPDDRYQDMGEVIKALEGFLGVEGPSTFAPREQHANLLERCVQEYNASPWARRRRLLVLGFTTLSALVTGLLEWKVGPFWGVGVAVLTAVAWVSSFITRGLFEKGALFLRFRQFVFQAPLITWAIWLLLLGGGGYGIVYFKLILPAIILTGVGLLFAIGFYVLVDRHVEEERRPPISQVEQMLRSMRLRGLEEGALRQFVCNYSGDHWEAFFEALFGYDAKMLAREKWGRNSRDLPRGRHSTWRDPLIRGIDFIQESRRRRRERRQMRMLDRKRTQAREEKSKAQKQDKAEETNEDSLSSE